MDDELLVLDRVEADPSLAVGESIPAEEPHATGEDVAAPTFGQETMSTPTNAPLDKIVEALLFASDAPLSAARLADLVGGCSVTEVRLAMADLNDKYVAAGLTFRIEHIARGYQMMTQPQYDEWLAKLNKHRSQTRLTGAALETLAIVAYKQPIIRADVEAIRGVACGDVLNRLREMGLVRVIGRADVVGRPLLYGTTRKFLDVFGLADLDDLPPMEALQLRRRTAPDEAAPAPLAASA